MGASDLQRRRAQVRAAVEQRLIRLTSDGKRARPGRLLSRLTRACDATELEVREALTTLSRDGLVSGVDGRGVPREMVEWRGPRPDARGPEEIQLGEALAGIAGKAEIRRLATAVSGLSTADITALASGLIALRDARAPADVVFSSSAHLMGSAKALGSMLGVARSMGIEVDDQNELLYVLTAGATMPRCVVLIENLRSFQAFAASRHADEALGLAAFGYGLTMANFGDKLARDQVIACPTDRTSGHEPYALKTLFGRVPVLFWGDLDREGLRIFASLRRAIPSIRLSAAYGVMARQLAENGGHPYHKLFGKPNQRAPVEMDEGLVALANLCRDRALDQEALGRDLDSVPVTDAYSG